jgi:hypothetical protein
MIRRILRLLRDRYRVRTAVALAGRQNTILDAFAAQTYRNPGG